MWIELHKKWLSEGNRLAIWNHLRDRANLPVLTLENAATFMLNPKIERDLKEYIDE